MPQITVKCRAVARQTLHHYMFEFENSNDLTSCILMLYRKKSTPQPKSHLYMLRRCYRLIIESNQKKETFNGLYEFAAQKQFNTTEIAYTEEYGKALILSNAISVFGKAFAKD